MRTLTKLMWVCVTLVFIDKWDGKTPLYGIVPEFLKMTK